MRVIVAGILGGLMMFLWGFAMHMFTPLGEMGMKGSGSPGEQAALTAMQSAMPAEGVYMLPWFSPETMNDEAKSKAAGEQMAVSPYAFVVYQPQGVDVFANFPKYLGKQLAADTLAALLIAWVLALVTAGFGTRVIAATIMGAFSWVAVSLPYMIWYRFPLDFTMASLVENTVGALLAGFAIAWWLGRR
jgi:hypothetical protein